MLSVAVSEQPVDDEQRETRRVKRGMEADKETLQILTFHHIPAAYWHHISLISNKHTHLFYSFECQVVLQLKAAIIVMVFM